MEAEQLVSLVTLAISFRIQEKRLAKAYAVVFPVISVQKDRIKAQHVMLTGVAYHASQDIAVHPPMEISKKDFAVAVRLVATMSKQVPAHHQVPLLESAFSDLE